jgi:prolyl-tRNA synthetase
MKEVPSDAEIPSHQLMLRAGLIRQVMAGAYTYLPLGWRAVRKVEAIVREEMEKAGAIELFMPALCPAELWEQTGRIDDYGNALVKFPMIRGDREVRVVLGPTHEEVVTDLMARQIKSYRQLPITVFQIQTKFRNEERPRFGVMRTSEFQMKDAYSFGTNLEQLNDAYDQMYHAYRRIFSRCGLDYRPVEAESGPIGGDASHEFMVPADSGEDEIVHCNSCDYAANTERAETGRPAPAVTIPDQMSPLATVDTPDAGSIEQVSRMLGCEPSQMIKTLIYSVDDSPIAVLVRGDHEANEAKIRRVVDGQSIELADPETIRNVTGAPVGFAGPVGLDCPLLADHDVVEIVDAVTGANQADAHLSGVNIGRDYSVESSHDLRMATADDPCPRCDGSLELARGIEVGHVFKLGTKYSTALSAEYLDENEDKHPMLMGCYGIGINRIVAATAETSYDDNGLIWPLSIAPYQVLVIPLNIGDEEVMAAAESIYEQLGSNGVDVLMDDRKARPGFKFKDADLVGIPLRIIVGGKGLADGVVELKWRTDEDARRVPLDQIVTTVGEDIAARTAAEADAVPV